MRKLIAAASAAFALAALLVGSPASAAGSAPVPTHFAQSAGKSKARTGGCVPACWYYESGQLTPTTTVTGLYAAVDIAKPTMNTAKGDYHTLAEMTVQTAPGASGTSAVIELGWNVDPSVNTVNPADPHLFAGYWTGSTFHGYNTGVNTTTCAPSTGAPAVGSTLTPALKRFGIEHTGTWPNGWWYLAYDTYWLGCFPDSLFSAAGVSNFGTVGFAQAFGEVASSHDYAGTGIPPCAQMGNGVLGTTTTGARFGNAIYAGSGTPPFPSFSMSQTLGTPYYSNGLYASGRTFGYGGPGGSGTGNPNC